MIPSRTNFCIIFSESISRKRKPFKKIKKAFLFQLKSSSYFNFCPDFFDSLEKQLDKKAKINLKIYGIINWETNN